MCRHFKVGSCQDGMFCLHTWFGFKGLGLRSAKYCRLLPCHAKLGGNFVGYLQVCNQAFNLHNAKGVNQGLCDLQAQASKLMPHAWRDFEHVILTFGKQNGQKDQQACLTPSGFAYKDSLTQEDAEQACRVINTAERVDIAWDDNDEHAKRVLSQHRVEVWDYEHGLRQIALKSESEQVFELPIEVTFGNKQGVRRVDVAATSLRTRIVDLCALEKFQMETLRLVAVRPVSWHACRNVKWLTYMVIDPSIGHVPSGLSQLTNLEFLLLYHTTMLPSDFTCLTIKTLELRHCTLNLVELAVQLASMSTLKSLTIESHRVKDPLIPTELGLVTSLEMLHLENNDFSGSVPTELGQLSKLSKLHIQELSTSLLELKLPQHVLDLNIPTLLITR